ncbi:MAG TPA: MotA/TolQ/ExbB proton channel family protein [Polyangiaceae bacterium]|nr:MotA/TolQ/ExbB proton channel family protein [Polyangiaceae bacterium]
MLIERLLKVALLGSEWILYLLLALSVFSIATMFERWRYFSRFSGDGDQLRTKLGKLLDRDDLEGAAKLLDGSRTIEARVSREALRWAPSGPEAMTDAVDSELSRLRKELERGLNFLGTIGNNAPFVGLFGTVLGVIMAFSALGKGGQNSSAMGGVMSAIAEALVATGVGLFVALPAVVAYNVIQKRIGQVETDVQSLTKLISAYLKAGRGAPGRQERAVRAPEAPAAEEATIGGESSGRVPAAGAA